MRVPIDEVVYFDCITSHPGTGAAADADSTPTFEVFEEATDTDIGVGGNLTKRTSKTGNYRGSFTASAANGFEAGKWYSVIASATVNSVAGKARVMHFMCVPAESSAGVAKSDVSHMNGTSIAGTGTRVADAFVAMFNVAAPAFTVASVNQTGDNYARLGAPATTTIAADIATKQATFTASTSITFPTNFSALAITAGGAVTAGTVSDKTGYALTSGERTSIANEVEAQIIDDTDSEKVLTAITDKIASVNPSLSGLTLGAIASSVWGNGTRTLTSGANIVLAKGVGVTGFNDLSAAQVNAEVDTALSDYDAPTKTEFDAAAALLGTSDQLVKVLAAVYDSASRAGNVLTLSNGATQTIGSGGRTTAGP